MTNIIFSPFLVGWGIIIALPANILFGAVLSGDPGNWQTLDYPKDVSWDELSKGARFPAGIPPTLNRERIQQKTSYQYPNDRAIGVWE